MDEFDAELRRAFAALEDPADAGFAASVGRRVSLREKALAARGWLNTAAFVVAGLAFAYGLFGFAQAVAPAASTLGGEFGLTLAEAQSAVTGFNFAAIGAALMPLLLAAGAAVGGLAVARAATE